MIRTLRVLGPVLLAAFAAACGSSLPDPKFASEEPVGSGTWVEIDAEPAWVTAPTPREGYLRYVATGKSNLRSIAVHGNNPQMDAEAAADVERMLEPAVGAESAARAAAGVSDGLRMVRRACKDELLTHEPVVGNTLCTAWALWEIAVDDVVAPLDESDRAAARAALTR